MKMKTAQVVKLRVLIRKHTDAQIELAFKGCQNPELWGEIEDTAKKAKSELRKFIKELHHD